LFQPEIVYGVTCLGEQERLMSKMFQPEVVYGVTCLGEQEQFKELIISSRASLCCDVILRARTTEEASFSGRAVADPGM
jgi:hypothetical protein